MTKEEFVRQAEEMRLPMYRVASAYLRQESDRMDAAQEALMKAWQALPRLKEERYFKTWLIRILIRECVNIQRRQRRVMPMERLPEMETREMEPPSPLREAILALPENQRIVIVLYYMEGYTVEEIMKALRLPKGTVCSRLNRARQRLKEYLTEEADT